MDFFDRAVTVAHRIVAAAVQSGDVAVDATAGNGHDTVHLSRLVGPEGRVFAFDVQEAAITATAQRLNEEGLLERVHLIQSGHEDMAEHLPPDVKVSAVMFNLGYLPGGDREVITRPRSTVAALQTSISKLRIDGVVSVVVYPGHTGGPEEARAVEEFAAELDQEMFTVRSWRPLNVRGNPPFVVGIKRIAS